MISNVNIQQKFNVVDRSIDSDNPNQNSAYDKYSSQSVTASIAASLDSSTTNSHSPVAAVDSDDLMRSTAGGDNGFSIYERNIDFHKNFNGDHHNVTATKDKGTSQTEPNLLLKNVNNNNHMTSMAAAREVESVHNYSKNAYSTNLKAYDCLVVNNYCRSIDEDEEDEDELIGNNGAELKETVSHGDDTLVAGSKGKSDVDDGKATPDHHARRPMNAFLIFCKRHRAIVREKYPNLENRSITKILGDWWANLDQEEKICYTNLAKQYKDAFFSANPNFKWYKLPAPPLRTLSTRPGNIDRPLFHYSSYGYDPDNELSHRTNDSATQVKEELEQNQKKTIRGPNVGIFKLADEAQMGGLNSLMASYESSKSLSGNNNLGEHDDESDPDNSVNLSKVKLTPTNRTEPFSNMRCHAAKMQSQIDSQSHSNVNDPTDAYTKDSYTAIPATTTNTTMSNTIKSKEIISSAIDFEEFALTNGKLTTPEKNFFFEDENLKKSARACKGKRYLEFMSSGKISPSSKKVKTNHPISPTAMVGTYDRDYIVDKSQTSAMDHMYASQEKPLKFTDRKADATADNGTVDPGDSKLFDASDFDLEEKIRALPALSLDKYLSRKRETKKKKKINSKRLMHTKSPQTISEAKERIRNSMVGSQKRKARKESITRRDINHDAIETVGLFDLVEAPMIEDNMTSPMPTDNASDLFFLATIAEVAAGAANNKSMKQEN